MHVHVTDAGGLHLYLLRHRVHHFVSGLALVVLGAALMVHDRADRHVCWHDLRRQREWL